MKKFLLLLLSMVLSVFCFACGDKDKEDNNRKNYPIGGDVLATQASVATIYDEDGEVVYSCDDRVLKELYTPQLYSNKNGIELKQNSTYYLHVAMYDAAYYSKLDEVRYKQFKNPAAFDENGELVSQPSPEYDSEYLQVASKINFVSCVYMIKGLRPCGGENSAKTTITIPLKDLCYPDVTLSLSIVAPTQL